MATAEQYAAWIVQNQDKKGSPEFETVASAYKLSRDSNSKYKAAQTRPEVDPTEGMSFLETTRAGLGKALVDTGRGIKQLTGLGNQGALQKTIDEEKALTAPLMDTVGGNVGNITGHVGMALAPGAALSRVGNLAAIPGMVAAGQAMMAPRMTLGGAGIGAAMGAAQGLIQPVASDESRFGNTAIPAAFGSAFPALGMGFGAARGAIEPLYQGGREAIIGRALRSATGEANAPQAIQNLRNAPILIPGSQPTAAEVANSGGIAAMQRAASAVDPEAYAARGVAQNEARVGALRDLAGTGGQRDFFAAQRDATANQLYGEARDKGVDIFRNPTTGQYRPKAERAGVQGEITKLTQRPAIQEAMERARVLAANEGINLTNPQGSIQGLDYVKRGLDDMIKKTEPGSNEGRVLTDLKNRLLTTVDRLSPKYEEARTTFTSMSRPINQMDVGQELADRSINPLTGIMQPQAFARNMNDDLAARATGYNRATLANTMEPAQMGMLGSLRDDLARSVQAQNLGRGAGSDTVQKLSMTNLMERSGLPVGMLNMPGLGRAGNWAYSQTDDMMKRQLAEALLDPRRTAALMQAAQTNPQLREAIEAMRRVAGPGMLGVGTSLTAQ